MNRRWIVILIAACTLLACKRPAREIPESSLDAIKALGSTVPSTRFDQKFWQRERNANSSAWIEAKRLCEQTVLANYPNCLSVNDIEQADQRKKAEEGEKAVAKNDEMFRRGYQYDFLRKSWLPFRQLMAAGCVSVPAYPNDQRRIGFSTWKCPQDTTIPRGISDPQFNEEEERATD